MSFHEAIKSGLLESSIWELGIKSEAMEGKREEEGILLVFKIYFLVAIIREFCSSMKF